MKKLRLKPMALALSGVMTALVMSSCAPGEAEITTTQGIAETENTSPEDKAMDNIYYATGDNVKLLGRTYMQEDVLWCAFSGTGAEFRVTASKVEVTIVGDNAAGLSGNDKNYARVAIYLDGERVIDDMIDAREKTYTVFEGETERDAVISVVKLSETAMSTLGIKSLMIEGSRPVPTAEKDLLIEFVGDSITCGYGVDAGDKSDSFSTETEDATRAYAYKTAQALGADYSLVSISGYGVISGYSGDGETKVAAQTIPQYYDMVGFSYDTFGGTAVQSVAWDFARQPDIIVVNLGTNDDSYCQGHADREEEYRLAYVEFLKEIRAHNPGAKLVCTLGIMGNRLYPMVEAAVAQYSEETGDSNITSMQFDQQIGRDGYGADWHPSETTHDKAAQKLIEFLQASPSESGVTVAATEIDPEKPVIALTFDDGPNTSTTAEILDVLEEYGVTASFFVIGSNIDDSSAEVVKRAYDMGCEINNHSRTHSYMNELTAEEIAEEIGYTDQKVFEITGEHTRFFRPPYIAVNELMFETIDLPFIAGFGANDWEDSRDAEYRATRIIRQAMDGGIILLHDFAGNSQTVEALHTIIPALLEEGYQLVTVSQLFEAKGVEPQSGIVYSNAMQTSMY